MKDLIEHAYQWCWIIYAITALLIVLGFLLHSWILLPIGCGLLLLPIPFMIIDYYKKGEKEDTKLCPRCGRDFDFEEDIHSRKED